jgi:uncharacterized RDD family membrane protein YckC
MQQQPTGSGSTGLPDNALPVSPATPSIPRRLAAWLYEGVLLFGIVMLVGLVFSVLTDMRHALVHRDGLIAVLFVSLAVYFTWFWMHGGQTLAMKAWRIRVVDRHGRPLRYGRAFLRYVYSYIWLLPPLAVFSTHHVALGPLLVVLGGWVAFWALLSRFHPQRQFLHDALAGTRLVDAPKPPPKR